jgi:hypothetical protein
LNTASNPLIEADQITEFTSLHKRPMISNYFLQDERNISVR